MICSVAPKANSSTHPIKAHRKEDSNGLQSSEAKEHNITKSSTSSTKEVQ